MLQDWDGEIWLLRLGKVGAQSGLVLSQYEIKAGREAAGLSQRELAQLVGVSKNSVSNWELGRTSPRGKEERLRRVLGLHPGPPIASEADGAGVALDDETVAAALQQASHLQILAELARRIQAAHDPDRELPPVPQLHLQWPMQAMDGEPSHETVSTSPEQSIDTEHPG